VDGCVWVNRALHSDIDGDTLCLTRPAHRRVCKVYESSPQSRSKKRSARPSATLGEAPRAIECKQHCRQALSAGRDTHPREAAQSVEAPCALHVPPRTPLRPTRQPPSARCATPPLPHRQGVPSANATAVQHIILAFRTAPRPACRTPRRTQDHSTPAHPPRATAVAWGCAHDLAHARCGAHSRAALTWPRRCTPAPAASPP
jgi:hypothetical protein